MGYIIFTILIGSIIFAARQLTLTNLSCPRCKSIDIDNIMIPPPLTRCNNCGAIF